MDRGWQTIELDGQSFSVRQLSAPEAELEVALPGDEAVLLRPWTLDQHLSALDRYAFVDDEHPRIDAEGLAAEVLARTCAEPLDGPRAAALAPLALWWAFGGDQDPKPLPPVRPWTCLERARALDECTVHETGALRFGSYLRAMARASCDADTDALCGATAAAFLDRLVAAHSSELRLSKGPGSDALMSATVRVCQALGWTPGQVWSLPATELDRLLALLDSAEAAPPPPAPPTRRSGLAAYPDAVIIEVS